jgi:hypothetical protein
VAGWKWLGYFVFGFAAGLGVQRLAWIVSWLTGMLLWVGKSVARRCEVCSGDNRLAQRPPFFVHGLAQVVGGDRCGLFGVSAGRCSNRD